MRSCVAHPLKDEVTVQLALMHGYDKDYAPLSLSLAKSDAADCGADARSER